MTHVTFKVEPTADDWILWLDKNILAVNDDGEAEADLKPGLHLLQWNVVGDAGTGMVLEGKYDDGKSCVKVNRPIPWPHASAKEDQPFLVRGK